MKLSLKQAIISAVVVLAGVSLLIPYASVFAAPAPVELAPNAQQAPAAKPTTQATPTQPTTQTPVTTPTTSTPSTTTPTSSSSSSSSTTDVPEARCEGGALGWILCPVIKLGQEFVAFLEHHIVEQLKTGPIQRTGRYEDLYKAWAGFRDLANVFFIGIFLVVIFAQALNIKMDSYSIKMMLPRLIIAAIAIQFSFFIMQIGVDISNVVGSGIGGVFTSVVPLGAEGGADTSITHTFTALGLTGVIGVGAAGLVVAGGLVVPVLLLLLAGALALIGVFITVWMRVLVLQFLILLAPLAMVAWVLPNTGKWFTMWRDNVMKVLLMYPIIVFIISAGALATHVAAITAEDGDFAKVLAACIPILVFFMIPTAIKASGSLMALAGGFVMGRMAGYSKGVRASQLLKDGRQDFKERALRQYGDNDPKAVNGFGKKTKANFRRGMGRVASGNTLSFQRFGDAGRRKMATSVNQARHAIESQHQTFFDETAFGNPELLKIAQAGIVNHETGMFKVKNSYGREYKFKMDHHLAEAAVAQMIKQQGMVEFSELLDGEKNDDGTLRNNSNGLYDHKTNQWRDKETQATMLRAMGPNAGAVLNKITHAVHLQGDKAYGELSGNNIAALGAGSGITAAQEGVKWNRVNSLNAMVTVINSNSMAGSIQNDVAKSFKRELIAAARNGKFNGVEIETKDGGKYDVESFLNEFISSEGQVSSIQGEIKRRGYDPILEKIKEEQETLGEAIKQARKERINNPDGGH